MYKLFFSENKVGRGEENRTGQADTEVQVPGGFGENKKHDRQVAASRQEGQLVSERGNRRRLPALQSDVTLQTRQGNTRGLVEGCQA